MTKMVRPSDASPLDFAKMPEESLQASAYQLQREVELMMNSIPPLNDALTRFKNSINATKELSSMEIDKEMLIPVTDSAYCEGKLDDTKEVYVDIGSGFLVCVSTSHAIGILNRRYDKLAAELKTIQDTLVIRRQTLELVSNELNRRAKEIINK
eukprot:gnl/Chilomastix_caulleri/313.p1 GENE.gnl/Chilomastix_caulleri/313~~gnl/Chilomastix_caulleri/313.p1  ORF type:complete len:154 (+),score=19.89 gnl/Chilomastix_caulleri/313:37-498(+)